MVKREEAEGEVGGSRREGKNEATNEVREAGR